MFWFLFVPFILIAALLIYALDRNWKLQAVREDIISYRDRVAEAGNIAPAAVLIHMDATLSSLNRIIEKHWGKK